MPTLGPAATKNRRPDRPAALDEVDRQILHVLAAEARITNSELAARVGVAPSTCLLRVRRLEEAGVVRGYRADLSLDAIGLPLQALVAVRISQSARADIGRFAEQFAALPGVLGVFFVSGDNDFSIHVAARSPEMLRQFVVENLSASRDVASTQTSLIFEHQAGRASPL